jgi:hypothetical protein
LPRENIVSLEKAASAREIQRLIAEKLKAQYDLVLVEPVPDRLAEVLKQLAQRMGERESETG